MAKTRSDRNDSFNSDAANSSAPFQEHDQRMRDFCLAHPRYWRRWGNRASEVHGSLLTLAPIALVQGIALARYSPN